jgi:hypothetical protein
MRLRSLRLVLGRKELSVLPRLRSRSHRLCSVSKGYSTTLRWWVLWSVAGRGSKYESLYLSALGHQHGLIS